MRVKQKTICIILTLILIFACSACSKKGSALDFYYFNTVIHVETYSTAVSPDTVKKLENLFSEIENEFDYKNLNSFTYNFNRASANSTIELSTHSKEIIDKCLEYYTFTEGKFNPGIYPLLKLWQFAPSYPVADFNVPNQSEINELKKHALSFKDVALTEDFKFAIKPDSDLKLDFGGIVKGYAADLASNVLIEDGHFDGYVSVGGSSLNLLKVPSLTVKHPRATELLPNLLSIDLKGKEDVSVSTSGDYERYYVKDEIRYSHLIDPETGSPTKNNVVSVTVLCKSGTFSDAITTAACLIEHDALDLNNSKLVTFLNKAIEFSDVSVFAIYDDGVTRQILTNEKEGETFTLFDKNYTVINIKG